MEDMTWTAAEVLSLSPWPAYKSLSKNQQKRFCLSTIYSIHCASTGRTYVGRSNHALWRIRTHVLALASGRHVCQRLQVDVSRHGLDSLTIRFLEVFHFEPERYRVAEEIEWMRLLGAMTPERGYNSPVLASWLQP